MAEVGTIAHTHAKSGAITHLHTAPHNASGRFSFGYSHDGIIVTAKQEDAVKEK